MSDLKLNSNLELHIYKQSPQPILKTTYYLLVTFYKK